MDLVSLLTPNVLMVLVIGGVATNALVIGVVAWGIYKLAPTASKAISDIPQSIESLRLTIAPLATRLEALEERVSDIYHQLQERNGVSR